MGAAERTHVDIQVASDADRIPEQTEMAEWVRAAIDGAGSPPAGDLEMTVRVVDEAEMQTLNREFRGKDRTTNVLSFPAGTDGFTPPGAPMPLGDVVVCAPVVLREAAAQDKPVEAHWAHLLVHGALHLMGYDHVEAADAEEMEALEVRILSQRGVADPYTLR